MENKLFRAGVGIADITPPIGLAIEGGFTVVRGEKVLDPLFVTVVALSDGTRTLLLTSIDLCIVSNASYQEMVRLVENTLHLPAESLIIASTHTHGSPLMGTSIFEGIPSDPEYTSYTIKKFITAAKAALDNMADARFAYGKAESRDYLFNRRVVDPQGKIRMNFIDAEYLKDCRVQGEPDPDLQLLRIEDRNGQAAGAAGQLRPSQQRQHLQWIRLYGRHLRRPAQTPPQAVRRRYGCALYAQRLRRHQLD